MERQGVPSPISTNNVAARQTGPRINGKMIGDLEGLAFA